ncbi:hypothetical protein ACW9I8_06190 [Pseudomonas reactans]|jgi:hypothetical protein|uniref:Uncharacterized protein n=3 Tax=Pseudomonas TaxID=286 RepID=A0A7Y7ZGJ0_9PSED|nr:MULTISPECIES: hypothetical protein [Pseudomonas]ASV34902.1 hypothetical protein CI807_01455 [Pseudomonas sp. NS1(2017)]KGE65831.1 hypothetical protein K814_0121880 [Pseudomonas fluorescens LMG 5329]NWA45732.1 hypothetical protein [Pseudomonas reactans]NWB30183.1 hypothetical protein [Pseudomonas gingeri]NWC36657.1 hypothetical protein [Pseudomonas gingeri]
MLSSLFTSRLTISSAEERLDQYRLNAGELCTISKARDIVDDAFKYWRLQISPRDRFSLTIGYDEDSRCVTDFSEASCARVNELFELNDEDDTCRMSVELIVHKTVQHQRLSLYAPALLGAYLESTPTLQVLKVLAGRMEGALIFECFAPIAAATSSSISFQCSADTAANTGDQQQEINRKSVFEIFQDNCFSRTLPGIFVPQDFNLTTATGVRGIDNFFKKARTLVSAIFIASSAELDDKDHLEYRICGYKTIAGTGPLDDLTEGSDILYKLVTWAYGDGGNADKIGLARNVLSLYITELKNLSNHPEIIHAIHSNYQIYLKENVESYLEVKGKITDILVDAVKKTHDLVDSFIDSLKNGIFVLLTFVLTVVVVNGLKDTSTSAIFSSTYIWVVVILCLLMSIWVFSARSSSLSQFDRAFDSIEELLKRNYHGVLQLAEVDNALNPVRISNRDYLRSQSTHYVRVWLLIVLLLITGFVIGNVLFVQASTASNSALPLTPTQVPVPNPVNKQAAPSPGTFEHTNQLDRLKPTNALDRRVNLRHGKSD